MGISKRFQAALLLSGSLSLFCGGALAQRTQAKPGPRIADAGASAPAPLPQTPANLKARQLVEEAIAALGGPAYLNSRYTQEQGRLYTFDSLNQLDSAGVRFWSFIRYPDAERVEFTKKRDVVRIYVGDKGWEVTYQGPHPVEAKNLARYLDVHRHSIDAILRGWASNPQTLMLARGSNVVDQQPVETVDFTNAAGESASVDFDATTHLPLRVTWRYNDPETGGYSLRSITYGNYQKVDGVTTAFSSQMSEGDRRLQQRYDERVSHAAFSDALFAVGSGKGLSAVQRSY